MSKYIIKRLDLFLESKSTSKGNTNLITDIVVSMLMINPTFLDNILNGQRSRYLHNTTVFLNDLKNLLNANNRLKLGTRNSSKKFEEDKNSGKINTYFNDFSQNFDMEKDWNKLSKARDIALNISKNLLVDREITESSIKNVFWISPNKEKGDKEDVVIELTDGTQYPIVINSRMNVSKTQSFNTLLDLMLDQQADKLFTDTYLQRWDKLTQEWFRIVYNNCKHELKIMIDQFIDASRCDSLTYFEYYDITIKDNKFKHLGKYVPLLNGNYKELSKLLTDIWKGGNNCIENFEEIEKEWTDLKKVVLNSKIIEHLMIDSLNNLIDADEVQETEGRSIISENKVKMRLMKVLVNLLNVSEIDNYYCTKDDVYHIPNRQWFRDMYDNMTVEYDYHQSLVDEDDSSQFRIKLKLNDKLLMNIELFTGFAGGEMSGRLNTKMRIDYVSDWNNKINNN